MRQFMAAVMMFMGMANMMRVHGSAIRKKDRNWMFSAWLLVIMFAYAIFGMAVGNKNETYRWFYNAFIPPINSTMYAMVAFISHRHPTKPSGPRHLTQPS
jgi:cell division protein FtsW (lipid II flippase)